MIDFAGVNWLAVIVSTVVSFAIGGLWYSALFQKPWMRLTGISQEQAAEGGASSMAFYFGVSLVTYFIAATALALLLRATGASGAAQGLTLGLLVGVGIVAAVSYNNYTYTRRPNMLYLIDIGYPVVALAISGVILGIWR